MFDGWTCSSGSHYRPLEVWTWAHTLLKYITNHVSVCITIHKVFLETHIPVGHKKLAAGKHVVLLVTCGFLLMRDAFWSSHATGHL